MDVEEEENMSKLDRWISDHFGEKMMKVIGAISMVLGFALAFALFVWMPSFLFDAINKLTGERITMLRTIFEGLLRIIIFVIYMFAVSKMKEIKRVYMYHGAEHKSIFCYESGEEMTVENVRKQSRFHPALRHKLHFCYDNTQHSRLVRSCAGFPEPYANPPRVDLRQASHNADSHGTRL